MFTTEPEQNCNASLPGKKILILGAGPAGMSAAYELGRRNIPAVVLEKNPQAGGLLRTLCRNGFLLDIGGHRFLSKNPEINALWRKLLGTNLLRVKRKSSIFYRGQYFSYPLKAFDVLKKFGPWETLRCLCSYVVSKLFPASDPARFEGWMIRRFGRRLYGIFFKAYTEKVWGIPCSELSGDWADQRIQDVSLGKTVRKAVKLARPDRFKTFAEDFFYPALGPGQLCEALRETAEKSGGRYRLGLSVEEIRHSENKITDILVCDPAGKRETLPGDFFLSSLPLPELIRKLRPLPPPPVLAAAAGLTFRSFVIVYLIADIENLFPDQWLYVHDPEVRIGRIQNYKNWNPAMVPDPSKTSLGIEYFAKEGDGFWNLSDAALRSLALSELAKLGFPIESKILDSFVVKIPDAYPLYGPDYRNHLSTLRAYLETFPNLQTLGRGGLFRYNNIDHAMMTGLSAARNLLGERHDLWALDPDNE
jgi:protoporphyrinogen oxidase